MPLPSMRLRIAAACGLAVLVAGCALPLPQDRPVSTMLDAERIASSRLATAIAPRLAGREGQSGLHLLADAHDAFAARVLLARAAEHSLDVQYYIWREDTTGRLLLDALREAADRGVRVRLLLDDNGIPASLDTHLAALDTHPHVEVRLFNPFTIRRPKALGYLTHFARANRRMHNKSFTADQQATIIGGRNIGDEYFGATTGVLFADLDLLAIGPVVDEMSRDFDHYWASDSAYPLTAVLGARLPAPARRSVIERHDTELYMGRVRESPVLQALLDGVLELEWAPARLVSDDPAKGLGLADDSALMIHSMVDLLGQPERSLDLVSPYFVPTAAGTQVFAALAGEGIRVRVLTNALEATDVFPVHAGYAKRRRALLKAGVELYEMRRQGSEPEESAGPFGSSGSSLHAKTFTVDRQRLFVGSFNFDPRSAMLNTELGFVIDSPVLAAQVSATFDDRLAHYSYRVHLDERGRMVWDARQDDGSIVRLHREPDAGLWRRLGLRLLAWLPIEWLL